MSILSYLPDAGTELQLHEPTVQRMQEHYSKRGVELNEARLRMATLPAGAEVMPSALCCIVFCSVQNDVTNPVRGMPANCSGSSGGHQCAKYTSLWRGALSLCKWMA